MTRVIYYKAGKLNVPKTAWSLTKYYIYERLNGYKPSKAIVETSVE